MVRPFFKWMVSAHAPVKADATAIKRMVTRSRIQAHSSNWREPNHVTKVLRNMRGLRVAAAIWMAASALCAAAAENPANKPAEALYLQLGEVGLDPARVYQVRGASLDRAAVHITLEDGTIGFTQDVMGRITGAFFEGEGEVLLSPPNSVERRSMSLFTGMAILEEHFATAYFRFNDDAETEMRPDLRATDNKQEFVERWDATAKNLAVGDAMRLLMTFSRMLPVQAPRRPRELLQNRHGDLRRSRRGVRPRADRRRQRGLPRPQAVRHSRDRPARHRAGGPHRRAIPHRARGELGDARRR